MRQVTVLALTLLCFVSARAECEVNGQVYQAGEDFQPSACEYCRCEENGEHHCAVVMCMPPPCVDRADSDEHCCGYCPNGRNCAGPDGRIVSEGEEVEMPNGARCSCEFNTYQPMFVCMLPV